MPECKYYDSIENIPLSLDADCCELAEWRGRHGHYRFARHPKGFLIFLPPEKLEVCDEYSETDPYSVEQGIGGGFQRRRINITIELVCLVSSLQKDTSQILDLGCGQGHISERIRRELHGVKVTGLDYSLSAIEYAHDHFPEIDFIVGDAYESPFAENFFDVVVCNNLWEHVADPLCLLGKIRRVLKPGGYLILSTPSRYRINNLVRVLLGKPVIFMSKHHVTEYTVGQMKELLQYGGFEVKKVLSRAISGSFKAEAARRLASLFVSLVGSHHQLESTVFYLAQESQKTADSCNVLKTPLRSLHHNQ